MLPHEKMLELSGFVPRTAWSRGKRCATAPRPTMVVLISKYINGQNSSNLISGWSEHDDGGPDGQRRNGQNRDDHPVGSGELGVHADDVALLIADVTEHLMHAFTWNGWLRNKATNKIIRRQSYETFSYRNSLFSTWRILRAIAEKNLQKCVS